jgi:hypothetical protein
VTLAAGIAVAAVGGTAAATEAGIMPGGVERAAGRVLAPFGVPVPTAGSGHVSGTPRATGARPSGPPGSGSSPTRLTGPEAQGLCRDWVAAHRDVAAMPAVAAGALVAAAGGADRVGAFCAPLLASAGATAPAGGAPAPARSSPAVPAHPTPPATHHPAPTPSHPGGRGQSSVPGGGR